ncbi:MAG: M48 family metalloprotease, partial [Actinomycetota bacterium]
RQGKKNQGKQIWALLATLIAGAAGGGGALSAAGNIFLGSQYVMQAAMSGYSQDLETEADRIGVLALTDTGYNPLGILTFMQKMARDDHRRGNPDFGIYQSHPYSNQRVAAIKKELTTLGYRIDPGAVRQVSGSFRTEVVPLRQDGRETAEVRLNGNLVFAVAAGEENLSPRERARRIAARLSAMFSDSLSFNDVRKSEDRAAVLLRGIPVIRVFPEDAQAAGGAEKALDRAYREITRALLAQQIDKPS